MVRSRRMNIGWSRALFVAVAALSVVVWLVAVPSPGPAGSQEEPEVSEEPAVADSVDDVDLGFGRTVPDVEMRPLRDAHTKTFTTNTLGVWRSVVTEEPVHYLDAASWEPIDSSLHQDGDSWVNGANAFELRIDTAAAPEVALVLDETTSLHWGLPLEGEVSAELLDQATLSITAGTTSVEVVSQPRGVKEVIVLDAAPTTGELRFPLVLDGLTPAVVEAKAVTFTDSSGAVRAVIPAGHAIDTSTDPETGEPAYTNAVTYSLAGSGETLELVVSVDEQWLNDIERVYPVRIDPTVTVMGLGANVSDPLDPENPDPYDDTYLVASGSAARRTEDVLKTGFALVSTRTLLRFPVQEEAIFQGYAPGAVDVLDATIKLHMETGSCVTDKPVQLRPILNAWPADIDDTDWGWTSDTANVADPLTDVDETCDTNDSTFYEVTGDGLAQQVEEWIEAVNPATNHGLMLRATTENQLNEYKRFRSANYTATPAHRPAISFTWTYKSQHLQVRGQDSTDTEYTDFAALAPNEPNCYPEPGAPSAWGIECKLDLYWKTGTTPTNAIVLVHSGGFVIDYGDDLRDRRQSPLVHMIADAYAEHDYLVAVIDYRQDVRLLAATIAGWVGAPYTNLINLYGDIVHCTQRWSSEGSTPYVWPPDDLWTPNTTATTVPALPDECAHLADDEPPYNELDNALEDAAAASVADVQAAVAWLRTDPNDVLYSAGITPNRVFLVGRSAGAFAVFGANYHEDSISANNMHVDGVVVSAGTHILDRLEIDDDTREMPESPGPLLYHQWEHDLVGVSNHTDSGTGVFDYARLSARHLRDEGHVTELRVRCGNGHIAEQDKANRFNSFMGESLYLLDGLAATTPVLPDDSMWFGGTSSVFFDEHIAQDLIEDRPGTSRFSHVVGDFNGDGIDDIAWYASETSPAASCGTVWYSQGDGSFARTDKEWMTDTGTIAHDSTLPAEALQPDAVVVGDFDGDDIDDMFWYHAGGTDDDVVWYGKGDPYDEDLPVTGTFCRTATALSDCEATIDQAGAFDTVVVGDFDGDGYDDLFFHDDTNGDVEIWYGSATQGSFTIDTLACEDDQQQPTEFCAPHDEHDVVVGDFNGDGKSDIYFPSATNNTNEDLWYGTSTRSNFGVKDPQTDDVLTFNYDFAYDTTVVGFFDNNIHEDIYFYSTTSNVDRFFNGVTGKATGFVARNENDAPTGTYELRTGYFTSGCCEGIIFRPTTSGSEIYFRPRTVFHSGTSTTFHHHDLGNNSGGVRTPITGQFGIAPGGTTARADILWHHTNPDHRTQTGPLTGGAWWWPQGP